MTHEATGSPRLIDWDFARGAARRVVPAGPAVTARYAQEVVDSLRAASVAAHDPVSTTARLHAPQGAQTALIVDRPTWVDVNVTSFSALIDPIVGQAFTRDGRPAPGPVLSRVSGKVTGAEVAGLLSFLSTKVLGQYDLALGCPPGQARLLLVAPNVVAAERELQVSPEDFRLWVCLHEETHRVQFSATPWLREHVHGQIRDVAQDLAPDPRAVLDRLRAATVDAPSVLRSGGLGLAGLFLTPDQRRRLEEATAVMALLEGHADVVMDDVGPRVVPSVAQIRERFERRRDGVGVADILLRRLLGLEAKMAQYRDGAAFVRAVTQRVGVDGFNAVWSGPAALPTPEEIRDPLAWVARVQP